MGRILTVGQDEALLSSRVAILRRCEAEVVAARASEALKILTAQQFDLVVLCHTVTMDDMKELVRSAHRQASDLKVLQILKTAELSRARTSPAADDTTSTDPASLEAKVAQMLSSRPRLA